MNQSNKVSGKTTEKDLNVLMSAVDELTAKIPYLVNLSIEERKQSRKLGAKSVEYVHQCIQVANTFPNLMSKDFSLEEFQNDLDMYMRLSRFQLHLNVFVEALNDTIFAAGSDAMIAADLIYSNLKRNSKYDPSAKLMLETIGERFKGQGNKSTKSKMSSSDSSTSNSIHQA